MRPKLRLDRALPGVLYHRWSLDDFGLNVSTADEIFAVEAWRSKAMDVRVDVCDVKAADIEILREVWSCEQ